MRFGWNAEDSFKRTLRFAYLAAILYVLAYIVIYWFEPFSDFWNVVLANFFLQFASLIAAVIALLIWRLYDKTDAPRLIWGPFAIGLFLWLLGEITWGYLNITQGEVPVGIPDVFWTAAYPIFGLALFSQYRLLSRSTLRTALIRTFIAVLFIVSFTLLTYVLILSATDSSNRLDALVNSFYPVADFMLAVMALRLASKFSGGAFSRPWLGLLAFAVADSTYAFLELSGLYTWSVNQGNLLSTISDVLYLMAYLAVGLSLLYHWLFLKYGMRPQ
jgi:hypothetical protein